MSARYRHIVLDADSTLAGIEGIDWLAGLRDEAVRTEVEQLTNQAMDGHVPIDEVYARRLRLIRPTRAELQSLALAYEAAVAPGAHDAITALQAAGITVHIVSGGLRPALVPFGRSLGIPADRVHAVEPAFDDAGIVFGLHDPTLATQNGKAVVLEELALAGPVLAVGDGMTDARMKPVVQTFAAYIGYVRRAPVVAVADLVLDSFAALVAHALSA